MSTLFHLGVLMATAVAFIILLIDKLGFRDYMIERSPRLISKLFDCDFCLSFWLSLILAALLAHILASPIIIIIPIFSAPLARFLI